MGNVWKNILKLLLAAALLIGSIFLSEQISNKIYEYLEHSDSALLFRYASDGKFSSNIYFSDEIRSQFNIFRQTPFLSNPDDVQGLDGLARKISKYQLELVPVLSENQNYLDYLKKNDTSISEFFAFCEKIAELADNILFACRYLFFLLWVV